MSAIADMSRVGPNFMLAKRPELLNALVAVRPLPNEATDARPASPVSVKRGHARESLAARVAMAGSRALSQGCAARKPTQRPHGRGDSVAFRHPQPSRARAGGVKRYENPPSDGTCTD